MEHKQCTLSTALKAWIGMEEMMWGLVLVMDIVPWGFGMELLQTVQVRTYLIYRHCWSLLLPTAQTVYLSHGNTHYYANNTRIIISSIMTTDDTSLTCHTDSTTCCRGIDNPSSGMGTGEWLFLNGMEIPRRNSITTNGFYWSRYHHVVRLYRQGDIQFPLGTYCCRIPDSGGEMRTFCANIIGEL